MMTHPVGGGSGITSTTSGTTGWFDCIPAKKTGVGGGRGLPSGSLKHHGGHGDEGIEQEEDSGGWLCWVGLD